ncbi:MAG: hypothetical protein GY910_18715 [bacterium]|nr:hypothetical protein [bacterium]
MGGDVWLLDAAAPLAGDDHYEITGVVDMGSVGAAAPQSLVFVAEHNDATFSPSNGTPLFAPSFDVRRFNPITLTSVGGGTGFGWMVALSASVSSAVPFGSPISWLESS